MQSLVKLSLLLLLALPAAAQTDPSDQSQRQQRGARQRREAGQPPPGGRFEMMTQRLAESLDLDETQQAQYDEIVARYRGQAEEQRNRGEQMRELMEQAREAREAGDTAKAQELGEQVRAMRRADGESRTKMLDDVQKILRPDQVERLSEFREQLQRMQNRGGDPVERMARLKESLNLNEQQATKFDELAAQMRTTFQQARETGGDMREAMRGAMETFDRELRTVLTPEQQKTLGEFREQMGRRGPQQQQPRDGDPRMIVRAARNLDLTAEQRDRMKAIEDDIRRAQREGGRDPEAQAVLAAQAKKDILALLTSEQAQEFERELAQLQRRERGERPQRPDRDAGGR